MEIPYPIQLIYDKRYNTQRYIAEVYVVFQLLNDKIENDVTI